MLEKIPANELTTAIFSYLTDPKYNLSLLREPHGWHTNVSIVSSCLHLSLPPKMALSCGSRVFHNGGNFIVDIPILRSPAAREESSSFTFLANDDLRRYLLDHPEIVSATQAFDHYQQDSDSITGKLGLGYSLDFVGWVVPPVVYRGVFEPMVRESKLSGNAAVVGMCAIVADFIHDAVLDVKNAMSRFGFRLIAQS